MRGRCERHQLALGPSGCLLCRREQASPASTAGGQAESSAAALGAEPSVPAASPAAEVPAPAGAEPVRAASAMATLDPPRLDIQISPWALLVPAAALGIYLASAARSGIEGERAERAQRSAAITSAAIEPSADGTGSELADDSAAPAPLRAAGTVRVEPALEPQDFERPSALAAESVAIGEPVRDNGAERARQLAEARQLVDVTVYYTTWCPACRATRGYLSERGIRFVEHDVENDVRAKARHRLLNPRGNIPTIEIEGQVLVGFNPAKIERAIDHAARQRLARQ